MPVLIMPSRTRVQTVLRRDHRVLVLRGGQVLYGDTDIVASEVFGGTAC